EEKHLGLCCKGPCDLKTPLHAIGETAGFFCPDSPEPHPFQEGFGLVAEMVLFPAVARKTHHRREYVALDAEMVADEDILVDREVAEEADVLEGPCDAELCDGIGLQTRDLPALIEDLAFG